MTRHRYYLVERKPLEGAYPGNGVVRVERFSELVHIPEIAQKAWGFVEYDRALEDYMAFAYALVRGGVCEEALLG